MKDAVAARVTKRLSDADAEIQRLQAENAALVQALDKAEKDIYWMLNTRRFLLVSTFDYIAKALELHRKPTQPQP